MGDPPRYRTLREGAIADGGRAIVMAAGGAAAFAPVEYALTLYSYSGSLELAAKVRLAALTVTLSLWLWLLLAVGLTFLLVGARVLGALFDPATARGPGWFAPAEAVDGVRPGVPRMWGAIATLGAFGLLVQRGGVWAHARYVEPQLTAIVIAFFAIAALAIAMPLRRLFVTSAQIGAHALVSVLGAFNPLARWRAAGVAMAALVASAFGACWFVLPQSHSVLPVRMTIAAVVIGLGAGLGALYRRRFERRQRRRRVAGIAAAVAGLLTFATLWSWGADLETKYVAITASPAMDSLIKVIRSANDLDRDGFGSVLGENDCDPLDSSIHPGATDLPDDHIDQNCDGRDFSLKAALAPTGPALPVPTQYKRDDWNILFITIDTVRYDETSFGGFKEGPMHRDTTPRLADLVKRSTSFNFTVAPSAGTMASIPAILTSKFFHSGIALDENLPAGMPPKIKPENTTLPEIMKRGGYHTGVIASHHYWNDWGLDQGVDDYDNSIGRKDDPFIVAADKVTDHALAWISRQQGHKWFLWAHYIDPHGRYVAHPDVIDYGSSERDLYDAELRWTDQQIGRLLDELVRLPSNDRTIIIITSDHGDSMAEHNIPLGTHGTALYRELLHVPMIFYVPNLQPHIVGGAVTNLDIVPTIAELTGIDVKDLSFEGKSLVPQIFYDKEDHDRIVFSETNAPTKIRAAVSEAYKLIFYMQSNLYELYDLKADPWEKTNLAPKNPPAMTLMKTALEQWLERVVYSRNTDFNQTTKHMAEYVLAAPPKPETSTRDQHLDGGKIDILGIGLAPGSARPAPGAHVDIDVYFKVNTRSQVAYKFLLATWPVDTATWKPADPAPATMLRSAMRPTDDGLFASDHWRTGEYIRDHFPLTLPADWHGNAIAVGLVATDPAGTKAEATGAAPGNDSNLLILGTLPTAAPPTSQGSSGPSNP